MARRHRFGDYSRFGSFGTQERIDALQNKLNKNIAVRDGIPIVGHTERGNVGVYGACGRHVIAVDPNKVGEVAKLLQQYDARSGGR